MNPLNERIDIGIVGTGTMPLSNDRQKVLGQPLWFTVEIEEGVRYERIETA